MTEGKDDHARFIKHLDESSKAVFVVAYYLHELGMDLRIDAIRRCASHAEWKKFKDDGDLFILRDGNELRIEVKGSSRSFTKASDWMFPSFFVCAKHSYDLAEKKPYAYFILNAERTHAAIVNTDTHSKWEVVTKKDYRYENMVQQFYTCPIELVKWKKIRS